MKQLTLILLFAACLLQPLRAQKPTSAIQPLRFLSGHWTSLDGDEFQEEYWSPISGENIVGTFRVVKAGKPVFYEFWTIEEEAGIAVFKMKHFNAGLVGWEDKSEVVRLPVKQTGNNSVLFSREDRTLSLSYELHGDDLVSTLTHVKDGITKTNVFKLHRQR